MDNNPLKTAIELIRSGQKQSAQNILQPILKEDVHNIPAWFWYVETCSTVEQRLQILEVCAKFNPNSPEVNAAIDTLRKRQMQPVDMPKTETKPYDDKPKATSNNVIPNEIPKVVQKPVKKYLGSDQSGEQPIQYQVEIFHDRFLGRRSIRTGFLFQLSTVDAGRGGSFSWKLLSAFSTGGGNTFSDSDR